MRCAYCHNADTWQIKEPTENAQDVLQKAMRYAPYWKDGGGITVSGGEPLLQIDFLIELFTLAKEKGIHTTVDTSGQPFTREEPFFSKFQALMEVTDLLLVDVKHMDSQKHKEITMHSNENILDMLRYLSEINKPVWIRHVLVPTLTDNDADLMALDAFLSSLKNIQRVEVLPYHTLGAYKWKALGETYRLEGVDAPSLERIENANALLHTSRYE